MSGKRYVEESRNIPLEIIDVQPGSYLDEDDIVRFDDYYGRPIQIVEKK